MRNTRTSSEAGTRWETEGKRTLAASARQRGSLDWPETCRWLAAVTATREDLGWRWSIFVVKLYRDNYVQPQ